MPSLGASWQIRRRPRAAPLDKEEPRTPHSGTPAYGQAGPAEKT
jgi:hypothetical protein